MRGISSALPSTGRFDGELHTIKSGGAFTSTVNGKGKNIDGSAIPYTQASNREATAVRVNALTDEWEIVARS